LKDTTNIEIAAVCDTWRQRREKVADVKESTGKEPMQTAHYADVLAPKDIDAVVIGTPDHLHCTMLVEAIKAGKDV
jgi:predicted dehydrogenase